MTAIPLAIDVITVFCLAAFIHWHYANWRSHHVLVTLATFIAFYFPFLIICILPMDVVITCYRQCVLDSLDSNHSNSVTSAGTATMLDYSTSFSFLDVDNNATTTETALATFYTSTNQPVNHTCTKPWSYLSENTLPVLWHIIYWTSQALTWIMLPMMQSYAKAGEFTVLGKIKYSLIANAIYYGTYLLIFTACLIYLTAQPNIHLDAAYLKVLAITASNTWGLFLLVLLLGYGLVDVPRSVWYRAQRGYMLSKTRFKVAKMSLERIEAEEELEDVLLEVKKLDEVVQLTHPCRRYVNIIMQKCGDLLQTASNIVPRTRSAFDNTNQDSADNITQKSLVSLHRRTIFAIQNYRSTQCQWKEALELAMDLEDVANNQNSNTRVFMRYQGSYKPYEKFKCNPTLEWYWKCMLYPWFLRCAAVCLAIFSFIVVWSECLFFVRSPVLSIFALFIQLATVNYNYFAIQCACLMTIFYLSFCAYYTIFKMRIFNYYNLVGKHQTNENSIVFCGMMLCRLTPPLCLNFLGLIHLDTHVTKEEHVNKAETAYTHIMGHMDVISFISNGFNIYFPIAICILCIMTFFKVGGRLLHLLGFQQFIGDDDMTQELVDEGAQLVSRERRKMLRQDEADARRRTRTEPYSNSRAGTIQNDDDDDLIGRRPGGSIRPPLDFDDSELLNEAVGISRYSPPSGAGGRGGARYGGPSTLEVGATRPGEQGADPLSDSFNSYQSSTAFRPQTLNTGQSYGSANPNNKPRRTNIRNIFDDV